MNFNSQVSSIQQLTALAGTHRQSILIAGPQGCGKTYLAKQYANMLGISDFSEICPKVNDIRDAVDEALKNSTEVLLCIENLDLGVPGASYTLLKTLEEPIPGLYIIVTCRNWKHVPDTIVSRSAMIEVSPPTNSDLVSYGNQVNSENLSICQDSAAWRCCRSFSEVEYILSMTKEQLDFYDSLCNIDLSKDNVNNIVWSISHYPDNSPCNVEMAIRCIMQGINTPYVTSCGISCLNDLQSARISTHAVLCKFILDAKYCE